MHNPTQYTLFTERPTKTNHRSSPLHKVHVTYVQLHTGTFPVMTIQINTAIKAQLVGMYS